jgi:hypothetical protein
MSESLYRQGQNPLNQSLQDLVSESHTRPAIAASQSESSVDLDAINDLYHFGACGCPVCNGEGTMIRNPCNKCNGAGRTRTRRRISLRVPRGKNRERGSKDKKPNRYGVLATRNPTS